MYRVRFGDRVVAAAGYDPLCRLLEIEFASDGQVWLYEDVPEEVWYHFRSASCPDTFFAESIRAAYGERRIL